MILCRLVGRTAITATPHTPSTNGSILARQQSWWLPVCAGANPSPSAYRRSAGMPLLAPGPEPSLVRLRACLI